MGKLLFECVTDLDILRRYLVRSYLKLRNFCKCGSKISKQLRFKRFSDLCLVIFSLNVSAHVCIEQQRIRDLICINSVAAHRNINVQTYFTVYDPERDRGRSSEFVIYDFLCVKVIDALVFSGVSAVGKTFSDRLESIFNSLTKPAGKNTRFSRGIVSIFARLGAHLDNLSLLHDYHTLTVGYGDSASIGNDIVVSFSVRRTSCQSFLTLCYQYVLTDSLAVEKLLPLIGQSASCGADDCFDKTHFKISPFSNIVFIKTYQGKTALQNYAVRPKKHKQYKLLLSDFIQGSFLNTDFYLQNMDFCFPFSPRSRFPYPLPSR